MSSDIKIIQFNKYVKQPIVENKSKNFVLNGRNNENYQYIIDRYNGSTTNATIINSYINLFFGNGLSYKKTPTNLNEWVKFRKVLQRKELRKLISDFVLFNECTFQIIKAKDKKSLGGIYHLPNQQVIPSIENEDGEIEFYWYNKNWKKQNDAVDFPAFGTSKQEVEIYKLVPYRAGREYFSDPTYFPALAYAEAEEEIANYYISFIKNGLSFGYIINIPNGKQLSEEQKDEIERKIKNGLTGSQNAGRFIMSFNDGSGENTTVEVIQMNDSHKQWEYLTSEARQQIMTGHGVVSPMLFGIKDSTGFGNNADELDTAEAQTIKRQIQPKQREFLEALDDILNYYGINIELFFLPLTEASTEVQMSSDEKKKTDLDLFIELGEDADLDGYELESVEEVTDEEIELATQTGVAKSNAKSKFDTDFKLIRYRYAGNKNPEREFCKRMMKANKIYRREDIDAMGEKNVNPGFGMHPNPNAPYSIWKYKGGGLLSAAHVGGTCKHYWEKLTYKKKDIKIDVKSPIAIDKAAIDKASGIAGQTPHSR